MKRCSTRLLSCVLLWQRQYSDFHLRSLRHDAYQETYLAIRGTTDTADVAELKKKAYADFKDQKRLSLKEFTALNTVAKSQEVRLKGQLSIEAEQWLRKIEKADHGQLRFLKFGLYNDADAKAFKRQEKQKLWDAVRAREAELSESVRSNRTIQRSLFAQPASSEITCSGCAFGLKVDEQVCNERSGGQYCKQNAAKSRLTMANRRSIRRKNKPKKEQE